MIGRLIFQKNTSINPVCQSLGKQSSSVISSDDAMEGSFFLDRIFYSSITTVKKNVLIKSSAGCPLMNSRCNIYTTYISIFLYYTLSMRVFHFLITCLLLERSFPCGIRFSCDWCSLVNGVAEYIVENLHSALEAGSDDILLLQPLSNWILSVKYLRYLPYSVVRYLYDSNMVDQDKSNLLELLNTNYTYLNRDRKKVICRIIHQIIEFKVIVSLLERRWCPFMHLKKMAYRRNYHCFDSRARDHIELVGELLKEMGCVNIFKCDIDIYQCNVSIDAALSDPDEEPALFKEYLDLFL